MELQAGVLTRQIEIGKQPPDFPVDENKVESFVQALSHLRADKIIARNTTDQDLQANVFFFAPQIRGTVFNDLKGRFPSRTTRQPVPPPAP